MDANKVSLRFLIIGGIALFLLIPLFMIQELVYDREAYFQQAKHGVADGWGNSQSIVGPLLVVPKRSSRSGWTVQSEPETNVVFLPQDLNANIEVQHEIRRRGIFQIPVYVANVVARGFFDTTRLTEHEDLVWAGAQIVFGISDTHGIRNVSLDVAGQTLELSGLANRSWMGDGLQAGFQRGDEVQYPFEFSLSVRGSTSLSAILAGSNSKLTMTSSWPHPSFRGRYLPDSMNITDDGFSAMWSSHELAQGLPESWDAKLTNELLVNKGVVVDLYEPVNVYRSVERGAKYGVLFLAATFLTLLCFELVTGLRIHFVQYGATGLAMLVFFLALLSLAEHISFAASYIVASFIVIALVGWYVGRITRNRKLTLIFVGVLSCVYGILYMLLQMEAYALLVGTLVVLMGLAALMWTTQGLTEKPVSATVGEEQD